jgi:hypothetical protein
MPRVSNASTTRIALQGAGQAARAKAKKQSLV